MEVKGGSVDRGERGKAHVLDALVVAVASEEAALLVHQQLVQLGAQLPAVAAEREGVCELTQDGHEDGRRPLRLVGDAELVRQQLPGLTHGELHQVLRRGAHGLRTGGRGMLRRGCTPSTSALARCAAWAG